MEYADLATMAVMVVVLITALLIAEFSAATRIYLSEGVDYVDYLLGLATINLVTRRFALCVCLCLMLVAVVLVSFGDVPGRFAVSATLLCLSLAAGALLRSDDDNPCVRGSNLELYRIMLCAALAFGIYAAFALLTRPWTGAAGARGVSPVPAAPAAEGRRA